jgi:hypothetical protein
MSDNASPSCCSKGFFSEHTLAAWLIRLAAAMLLLISGMDKFKSTNPPYSFAFENWYGKESDKAEGKAPKWAKIVNVVYSNTGLDNSDRLGAGVANLNSNVFAAFGQALPWMFLVSGGLIALGLFSRLGHFLGGITWLSLAAGLIALPEVKEAVCLFIFAGFNVAGLLLNRFNRLTLDGLFSAKSAD